jgi:cephalosporin hydroxylase
MGNVISKVVLRSLSRLQLKWYGRFQDKFEQDFSFSEATATFPKRNDMHAYMHHHFYNLCPPYMREHRMYYEQDGRGFGEDVFHAMWFALLREFKPQQCLEIGVYRGQVISLWALIAQNIGFSCNVHGISPFTSVGDEVSIYMEKINYFEDTLHHHSHFGLSSPTLVRAYSTDSEALAHIRSHRWDLIYIDGNHDYDVALADYEICKDNLAEGGILVMDDSSMYTDYKPPRFSFAGHPGPSRVVQERAMKELCFMGGVGHNNIFMKS